jgi:hypothetical protein
VYGDERPARCGERPAATARCISSSEIDQSVNGLRRSRWVPADDPPIAPEFAAACSSWRFMGGVSWVVVTGGDIDWE